MLRLVFMRDLTLAFRKGGGALGALAFFVIVETFFVFALGPEAMRRYAAATLPVALLLANLIALPLLFERDHEDGSLEQWLVQPVALELIMLAKLAAYWVAYALPMLLMAPLIALVSDAGLTRMADAMFQLALASVAVVSFSAVAGALTLGVRRGGLLQAVVALPFYCPLLIFASAPASASVLMGLLGVALVSVPLACMACAGLLKA